MSHRKDDHLNLAKESQSLRVGHSFQNLDYEPLLYSPKEREVKTFLNYKNLSPLFISSMTAGGKNSLQINTRLAKASSYFQIPFALGSCRSILESDENHHTEQFTFRHIVKDKAPIIANLGIAQLEEFLLNDKLTLIDKMVEKIEADALAIHINLLQEFYQPEGDLLRQPVLKTLKEALSFLKTPIILKEVGQGMGPRSIEEVFKIPLVSFETASFG